MFGSVDKVLHRKFEFQLLRESDEDAAAGAGAEDAETLTVRARVVKFLSERSFMAYATLAACVLLFVLFQWWANRKSVVQLAKDREKVPDRSFAEFYADHQETLRARRDGPVP